MFWGNMLLSHWPCFTWTFLIIWSHKILKLIFQKQPSCPRKICTEHWRKLSNLTAFLEIFLCLKKNDVWKVLLIVISFIFKVSKVFTLHLVDLVVLNLYFNLVPPFYFLKWSRYFSACEQKFAKFFMSFLKAQVRFLSKFASIFSVIKHIFSVLF